MNTESRKISLPATVLRPSYDVVVIGSGYGGGIAASRMSRAGKRVALLEKGEERWPGSYPTSTVECVPELRISSPDAQVGKRNGLYQLHIGENQNVFVANGLGGTSLLNANVALRADKRTLALDVWPEELRSDPHALDEYYERAENMLQPVPYPAASPPLPKLKLLEEQARLLGADYLKRFYRPPITTSFEDHINAAGVMQKASTLTGNDTTGVNDGSKNSTLVNYVSDAWNHGCEIFCGIEVRYICYSEPLKKWVVFYAALSFGREDFGEDLNSELQFVLCDSVFLAAGTLGTNEILLRSRSMGLHTSPRVGQNFSGNGDILGFAYNVDPICNAISMGSTPPSQFKNGPVGPCITGIIDMRDEEVAPNVLDGYVIEEGVVPHALANLLGPMLRLTPGKLKPPVLSLGDRIAHTARSLASVIGGAYVGALKHTQTYLIMSHDDDQGELTLKKDQLDIVFADVGRESHIEKLNATLGRATQLVKGSYVPGPFYTQLLDRSLISVHPVGGSIMGDNGELAATNHKGQVFSGTGTEVHSGLYVCDGAVIPTPLGVNPFLTISALAERTVDLAAKATGAEINMSPATPIDFLKPKVHYPNPNAVGIDENGQAIHGGISFTEVMHGYFSSEVSDDKLRLSDYENAADQAKSSDSDMRFLISVIAYDMDALTDMNNHSADMMGTVACRALSAHAMSIISGNFRLFTADPLRTDTQNLVYELKLMSVEGVNYLFRGFKEVDNSGQLNPERVWEQTTTLYTSVYRTAAGSDKTTALAGLGILQMSIGDFQKELLSFQTYGAARGTRIRAATEFVTYFAQNLVGHFLPNLAPLTYVENDPVPTTYSKRRPDEQHFTLTVPAHIPPQLGSEDATINIKLVRWNGGGKGPVLLVPGAAVTHDIFSMYLIKHNFVDYLLERGYDVFALDHRLSPNVAASKEQFTVDDLRIDVAWAVDHVRKITGVEKLSVVSHCAGALAATMGILDGTTRGVGSLLISQVCMHPVGGVVNNVKAALGFSKIWQRVFRQNSFNTRASRTSSILNWVVNQVVRFYPMIPAELCSNASCHRQSFLFGRLYAHKNLSPNVHSNIDKIVGGATMTAMNQFAMMTHKGKILSASGENVYVTPENIKSNFAIPTTFVHGLNNVVYAPEGTKESYDLLREVNGPDLYARFTFEGMGHLDTWFGKRTAEVFPVVLNHLEDAATKYKVGYAGLAVT